MPDGNRAEWALDDVYIGGHEVNTPLIEEDFESPLGGFDVTITV